MVSFPIDWRADPFKSRSWMHHFSSLRWLNSSYSYLLTLSILTSFYKFHCEKKIKNPYYNEVRGDHTAAVRLGVLISIEKEYGAHADSSIKNIVRRLIVQEIKNLQSDKMYRSGHNHGLMVDLALLNLVLDCPEYQSRVNLELVLERSAKTLDAMWHASGLTKEHSVSYQEYNLPLTIEYFEILEKLNVESLASVNLKNVVTESRKFLGYALKGSGEYFPLGDSFRLPNENILNKVFGQGEAKSARELLMPYSKEEGVYCNKNFFIFRKTVKGRKVHFAATCCWDSHNHKQNDDLSFCLEVDGVTIFDDPGYTEFLPWESVKRLQSEVSHSTITASRVQWGDVRFPNGKSSVLNSQYDALGFSLLMSMERYDGFKVVREVQFNGDILTVADQVVGQGFYDLKFNRKLVLGPEIVINSGGLGTFEIEDINGRKIAELQMEEESPVVSSVQLSESEFVLADRKLVKSTQVIISENIPVVDGSLESDGSFVFPSLKLKLARSF
ncbi:heparinase II/III domain-containing protein [Vreelandella alkaliphila]|uniref:heparinase II/III domain-containing protein n=1 Tax=Vreelandella alkaliphila TaxID=272774 RepID=UPI003FD8F16B